MSVHERALRFVGKSAVGFTVATPPLWIVGLVHPFGVLALVFASLNIGAFGLWYLCWILGNESSNGRYEAAWLGAGTMANGDSPIYMCSPYWVYGAAFHKRVRVRRIAQLERACGLSPSAFTSYP